MITVASDILARFPAATAVPVPGSCGIYFLCLDGVVVYVGQSRTPEQRVLTHHADRARKGMPMFDSAFVVRVDAEALDVAESALIRALEPEWNGRLPNGVLCTPISADRMDDADAIDTLLATLPPVGPT